MPALSLFPFYSITAMRYALCLYCALPNPQTGGQKETVVTTYGLYNFKPQDMIAASVSGLLSHGVGGVYLNTKLFQIQRAGAVSCNATDGIQSAITIWARF